MKYLDVYADEVKTMLATYQEDRQKIQNCLRNSHQLQFSSIDDQLIDVLDFIR